MPAFTTASQGGDVRSARPRCACLSRALIPAGREANASTHHNGPTGLDEAQQYLARSGRHSSPVACGFAAIPQRDARACRESAACSDWCGPIASDNAAGCCGVASVFFRGLAFSAARSAGRAPRGYRPTGAESEGVAPAVAPTIAMQDYACKFLQSVGALGQGPAMLICNFAGGSCFPEGLGARFGARLRSSNGHIGKCWFDVLCQC